MAGESQAIPDSLPDPSARTTEQLLREIFLLKEFLNNRIDNLNARMTEIIQTRDERVKLALTALTEANQLASKAFEKRLDELNQFRAQNKDQEARFAIAEVVAQQFKAMEEKILASEKVNAQNQDRLTRMEAIKQGGVEKTTAIYAFAGFIVTLIIIGTVLAANGVFTKK